jgi:UDP-N-acetylmuramate-alanine ligase
MKRLLLHLATPQQALDHNQQLHPSPPQPTFSLSIHTEIRLNPHRHIRLIRPYTHHPTILSVIFASRHTNTGASTPYISQIRKPSLDMNSREIFAEQVVDAPQSILRWVFAAGGSDSNEEIQEYKDAAAAVSLFRHKFPSCDSSQLLVFVGF